MNKIKIMITMMLLSSGAAWGQWVPMAVNTNTGEIKPAAATNEIHPSVWAEWPALDDIDADDHNLLNVSTGWFDAIYLGGVLRTNWSGATGPGEEEAPGTIKLQFDYSTFGEHGGGKIYISAYDNKDMAGWPIYTNALSVELLRSKPLLQISNTIALAYARETWWYAWMDADGDGLFNAMDHKKSFITNYTEPAAVAEFCPIVVTDNTSTFTINFAMVDEKGNTWRFGWDSSFLEDPISTLLWVNMTANQYVLYATNVYRNFWAEPDYVKNSKYLSYYLNFSTTTNGHIAGFPSNTYATFYLYIRDRTGDSSVHALTNYVEEYMINPYEYGPESCYYASPSTPVGIDPTGGESIDSTTEVALWWTNTFLLHSQVEVKILGNATGEVAYSSTNYLENQHSDGRVGLLLRNEFDGLTLDSGSNYYWKVRTTMPWATVPSGWSAYQHFVTP